MARKYAAETKVPVSKTRVEIEDLLRQHGVQKTGTLWLEDLGLVAFSHERRVFRLEVKLPPLKDFEYRGRGPVKAKRSEAEQRAAWEQECRAKWRSILLIVKARLVAIEAGAESWESAFMAQVVMPNGDLLGPTISAKLREAYHPGIPLPPLLPGGASQ